MDSATEKCCNLLIVIVLITVVQCNTRQSCVQIIKLVNQNKSCVHRTKIKLTCVRVLENKLNSTNGPVKSQIFVKRIAICLQINITINYTSSLFFIFLEAILYF